MRKTPTLYIVQAAVVAAAYILLTLPLVPIAFGPLQFRLAEAMTVLPVVFPAAIPGLFIGCLMSNLFNPNNLGPVDILFGSLATLLAAIATWRIAHVLKKSGTMMRRMLSLLPPVVINAVVVGTYLPFLLLEEGSRVTLGIMAVNILSIGLSEAVVVYVIGLPLLAALEKRYATPRNRE